MPIDFYYMTGSPPCYAVFLLGKTLGLTFNKKYIDYEKQDHKTPEYQKLNPQQTVPLINDNGFLVSESRAILCYLVEKYAKDDSLYPKDLKKRTVINQRLYFDIGTLYQGFLDYYCTVFETGKFGDPSKLEKIKSNFKILDTYLDGNQWVAGSDLSVADYTIAGTLATMESCGFDVSKYPNVSRYFAKIKKTLPGYEETVGAGSADLRKIIDSLKK